ncbi:MAG: MerR family transcriptional regulator [Acidobacteria bacterium]|nr:MerR family transcriptional regulator [Acidobacteriota bacterium]
MGKNGSPLIPEKDAYKISEVAALTELEPYVLRYWETEFPVLQPAKTPHGQRLYRRSDVETILTIKRLLYEQGFTIAGARKQLETTNGAPPPAAATDAAPSGTDPAREELRAIRTELGALLTLLSRR